MTTRIDETIQYARTAYLMYSTWECPHCDKQHRIVINIADPKERTPHVITCETEDGGCGKDAAIYPQLTLTVLSAQILL